MKKLEERLSKIQDIGETKKKIFRTLKQEEEGEEKQVEDRDKSTDWNERIVKNRK